MRDGRVIRPVPPADVGSVGALWYRSGRAAHPYLPQLQALTPEEGDHVFRRHVAPGLDLHALEVDGVLVGFLGLGRDAVGPLVDRLYVDPLHQGRGSGRVLLDFAKARHPDGLRLYTHVRNTGARRFYEREGFGVLRFGTSPPPENEPDVEYAWRGSRGAWRGSRGASHDATSA